MKISATGFHHSVHLNAGQLEPPDPACPFCGSADRNPVVKLQDAPEVFLLECARCHAASASRMPTDSALDAYYGAYYQSPQLAEASHKITFHGVSRFGRHLAVKYLRHRRSHGVSMLDFGGGDGSISHAVALELLRNGVEKVDISVVDYNRTVIQPLDARISITKVDALENVSSPHDFVIASAVLEHIPRPREVLDRCLRLVEKGGLFYARTPYMVPLMRLAARVGVRLDLTYPGHVHDLGQQFWEAFFDHVVAEGTFRMLQSQPSIVETSFGENFLKTLAAYSLKAPWHLLGRSYKLVGGWEVLVEKRA
ncbi:class I SAM-dependent methyltransferase [Pelomonas sp. BJYL3]|uniref:class I SAM-dependent methyltransferase n=1 Tax=Pelomonas sp. BJYL3 TaxID=2976697 RepID=UPI0022B3B269|nr:methyltransferase domain-containing protein [Pelomonas sp. BJYL3]